jgi:hypothetical protein
MNHQTKILTREEYDQYKERDDMLHEFTFAHGVQGWGDDNLAMTFYKCGTDYRISPALQAEAKREYERRKAQRIAALQSGTVAFIGMGCDFAPITPEHVGNHRIRAYFKNDEGRTCFVEFGSEAKDNSKMRCDHALIYTREDPRKWTSLAQRDATEQRLRIERTLSYTEYTHESILKILHEEFNAIYERVEIHEYFLSCDDITSTPRALTEGNL